MYAGLFNVPGYILDKQFHGNKMHTIETSDTR